MKECQNFAGQAPHPVSTGGNKGNSPDGCSRTVGSGSGPWEDFIDLLTIDTVGWGTTVPEGAVRELPNLPFSTPASIPSQSKDRLKLTTIFAI
jgi:hypothetical protein